LQNGQSRICGEERFGRASGFADEEFEEGELGCEEDYVVVGFIEFEFWDLLVLTPGGWEEMMRRRCLTFDFKEHYCVVVVGFIGFDFWRQR
jgi:hypothetical protein